MAARAVVVARTSNLILIPERPRNYDRREDDEEDRVQPVGIIRGLRLIARYESSFAAARRYVYILESVGPPAGRGAAAYQTLALPLHSPLMLR